MPLVKRGSLSSCPIPKSPCSLSALPTGGAGAEASKRDCSTCRTFSGRTLASTMALGNGTNPSKMMAPPPSGKSLSDFSWLDMWSRYHQTWNPLKPPKCDKEQDNLVILQDLPCFWATWPRQRPPLPSRLLQGLVHLPLEPIEKAPKRGSRGLLSLGK